MPKVYWQKTRFGYFCVVEFSCGTKRQSPTTRLWIDSDRDEEYLELTKQLNSYFHTTPETVLFPEDVATLHQDKNRRAYPYLQYDHEQIKANR